MNYIHDVKIELGSHIDVEDDLLDLYSLLVLTKGVLCTWEDVHDAWSVWRHKTQPDHKSIIPFDELSEEVQEMDKEYAEAIQETAKMLNL